MEKHPECERADEFKGQKGGAGDHEEWRQVPRTQKPWCSLPFTLKNKGSSPFIVLACRLFERHVGPSFLTRD